MLSLMKACVLRMKLMASICPCNFDDEGVAEPIANIIIRIVMLDVVTFQKISLEGDRIRLPKIVNREFNMKFETFNKQYTYSCTNY